MEFNKLSKNQVIFFQKRRYCPRCPFWTTHLSQLAANGWGEKCTRQQPLAHLDRGRDHPESSQENDWVHLDPGTWAHLLGTAQTIKSRCSMTAHFVLARAFQAVQCQWSAHSGICREREQVQDHLSARPPTLFWLSDDLWKIWYLPRFYSGWPARREGN